MKMRKPYWKWQIPTYLFLGGMGGGMLFLLWILNLTLPGIAPCFESAIFLAIAFLGIGCLLLVLDLGQPQVFYRTFLSSTAVIKWGSVILSVSLIFGFIAWLFFIPFGGAVATGNFAVAIQNTCLTIAGIFGLFTMVYTGVLLSSMKAKPFWNTPLLPVIFVTSGSSTGAAMLTLTAGCWPFQGIAQAVDPLVLKESLHILHQVDKGLIIAEMCMLLIWVLMMYSSSNTTAKAAAQRWLVGSWWPLFWIIMLGCGLLVPLWFYFLNIPILNTLAAIIAILGGLLLRFMIVLTNDRREIPGEARFWERSPKEDAAFLKPVWLDAE